MQIHAISGWNDHILAGRQYLETASNGRHRPAVFNNELVFQLAAMAIEKLMVGVCQYHRRMPFDHTLTGLVAGLAPVCPMDPALADGIRHIEQIDDMCSLSPVHRKSPDALAIQQVLDIGWQVAVFARQHVPWDDADAVMTETTHKGKP